MTGPNLYRVVAVSFGLLCIVQATLNIFLRLTLYKNSLNLETQSENVTEEELKKQLTEFGEVIANYYQQGWQYFSGSVYYVSSTQKTWNESREYCLQRDADLMIINSAEEQNFTSQLKDFMWIGLTDAETEGTWKWVDGTPLTTSHWLNNEPNDYKSTDEDCAEVRHHEKRNNWNDMACHQKIFWICEKNLLL